MLKIKTSLRLETVLDQAIGKVLSSYDNRIDSYLAKAFGNYVGDKLLDKFKVKRNEKK